MKIGIYLPYRYAPFRLEQGGMPKKALHLARRLVDAHEVILLTDCVVDEAVARSFYGVELAAVRQHQLSRSSLPGFLHWILPESESWRAKLLAAAAHRREIEPLGLDLFINMGEWIHIRNPSPRGIASCVFPESRENGAGAGQPGLVRRLTKWTRPAWRLAFDSDASSYDVIVANSRYTAGWFERWWRRRPEVVYAAASDMGPPAAKDRLILSVGRLSHSRRQSLDKRQAILIEAFRGLPDLAASGWRLALAGALGPSRKDRRCLRNLQQLARGLPVDFHPSSSIENLRDLYRRAPIYWHAAGFGSDRNREPGRQEHFGLTIVEAMSSGAVPLAYASGGPLETIEVGRSGFHWRTISELLARTRELVSDSTLRARMSAAAVLRSREFGVAVYLDRMEKIVERFEPERARR